MRDNEFRDYGENKEIDEYKQFDAVEYYKGSETAPSPFESFRTSEENYDNKIENKKKSRLEEERERLKNLEKMQSQDAEEAVGDGGVSDVSSTSSTSSASSSSSSTTTAASTSASASVTSTSTVLVATTVITAAAVAVIATSALVLKMEPTVDLLTLDVGANYVEYALDISDLDDSYTWDIKISNDTYSYKQVIDEEGSYSDRLTNLNPGLYYTLEVEANLGDYGYKSYYTKSFYTSTDTTPKALIDVSEEANYDTGLYSLSYDVYVSDYKKKTSNTRFDIYFDDEIYQSNEEVIDYSINGVIADVANGTMVHMECVTTYNDEEIVIGEYDLEIVYPDDFVKPYEATYDVAYSLSCDTTNGNVITITTGFDNQANENDYYILELVSGDEVITSYEGTDQEVTLYASTEYSEASLYLIEMRNDNGVAVEYDRVLISDITFDPEYLSSQFLTLSSYYMQYEGEVLEDFSDTDFIVGVKTTSTDGTETEVINDEAGLYYEAEYDYESTASLEFIIYNTDNVKLTSYVYDMTALSITSQSASSGVFTAEYGFESDTNYSVGSVSYVYNNTTTSLEDGDNKIVLDALYDPTNLNLMMDYTLTDEENSFNVIYSEISIDEPLNIEYELDYMVPESDDSSSSTVVGEYTLYYRFTPTIDGNLVNAQNWTATLYDSETSYTYTDYNVGSYSSQGFTITSITYDIKYYDTTIVDTTTLNLPTDYTSSASLTEISVPSEHVRTYNLDSSGEIESVNIYYTMEITDDSKYKVIFQCPTDCSRTGGGYLVDVYEYYMDKDTNTVALLAVPNKTYTLEVYQVDDVVVDNTTYEAVIYSYADSAIYLQESDVTSYTSALVESSIDETTLNFAALYTNISSSEDFKVYLNGGEDYISISPTVAQDMGTYSEDDAAYIYTATATSNGVEYTLTVRGSDESVLVTLAYTSGDVTSAKVEMCECMSGVEDAISNGYSIDGTSYIYIESGYDIVVSDSSGNQIEGVATTDDATTYKYGYSGGYAYTTINLTI